jgi:tetratricopeptide (TPR) repeat protein
LVIFIVSCGLSGCAGWNGGLPDVKPMREERATKAVVAYEKRRDDAQCLAAETGMRQGDIDGSIELLDRLLARNPAHREGQLLRINAALEQEDYGDARRRAEALLVQSPDDAAAMHLAGMACDALGEDEPAADYFRRAAEKEPDNALYAASRAALEEVEPASYVQPLAEPVAAPKKPTTALASSQLLKAELCLALGDRSQALGLTNHILSADEQCPEAQDLSDRLHGPAEASQPDSSEKHVQHTGPRPDRMVSFEHPVGGAHRPASRSTPTKTASQANRSAIHFDPSASRTNPSASHADPTSDCDWLRSGMAALDAGSEERAAEAFANAMDAAPRDEQVAMTAALAALKHDQPLLASQLAQQALAGLPRSAGLLRIHGAALYRLGEWNAARDALEQSLALDNSHALSYFLLGSVLQKLGESDAAQRNLQRAQQLDARYATQP